MVNNITVVCIGVERRRWLIFSICIFPVVNSLYPGTIMSQDMSRDYHMQLRTKQDEERKRLMAARDRIRNDMGIIVGKSHGPAQVDPNQCTDMTEKSGYLGKRPDNALRLPRRQWPKKYCTVSMQGFSLANSHVS